MTHALPTEAHVVVVDARPRDYHGLTSLAEEGRWHIHFLTTARAAITFVRRARADLWVINSRLPDMSGLDLLAVIREQFAGGAVLLVSDRYDADQERLACQLGAALYLCKDAGHALDCRALLRIAEVRSSQWARAPDESPLSTDTTTS